MPVGALIGAVVGILFKLPFIILGCMFFGLSFNEAESGSVGSLCYGISLGTYTIVAIVAVVFILVFIGFLKRNFWILS